MKKKNKTILVKGEKVKFIPATEFEATYHWQRTNKKGGTTIPVHIMDRYYAKKALREKIDEVNKERLLKGKKKK